MYKTMLRFAKLVEHYYSHRFICSTIPESIDYLWKLYHTDDFPSEKYVPTFLSKNSARSFVTESYPYDKIVLSK